MEFLATIGALTIFGIIGYFLLSSCGPSKEEKKELEKEMQRRKEEWQRNKEYYTRLRVPAYEYEDFAFSVVAPYAQYVKGWHSAFSYISKEELLHKIKEYPAFKDRQVSEVFDTLIVKEIFNYNTHNNMYSLGAVLESYANVISNDDMNLTKWIERHPEVRKREE